MRAPNGEQTKLTEQQWLAVRTPAFKQWFGDWEHDTENASKILDENGEPLVVYRGVNANFLERDGTLPGRIHNPQTWEKQPGAFFTSNLKAARTYTRTIHDHIIRKPSITDEDLIYKTFLNIRNPYIFNGDGKSWDSLEEHIVIADRSNNILHSGFKSLQEAGDFFTEHYIGAELSEAISKILAHEEEIAETLDEEALAGRVEELRELAEDEEFDEDAAREQAEEEEIQKRLSPKEKEQLAKYSEIHSKYRVASYRNTTDDIVQEVAHGLRGTAPSGEEYDGVVFTDIRDAMDVMAHYVTDNMDDLLGNVIVPLRPTNIKSATGNNGSFSSSDPDIYHQSISTEALNQAHSLASQIAGLQESYHQPYDSRELDALIKRNKRAELPFRLLMAELQSELGGELITRKQMKTPERIINKAYRVFGGDVSRVGDVWAGTLVFDTEDELQEAIGKLRRRRDVVHTANRWSRPKRSTGYRDFEAHLTLPDGTVVELQLQHKGIQAVKDNVGHSVYEFMSSNDKWGELHDYIWQAGDLSKRLYSAAMDGSYQALSARDKDTLRALGENLADARGVEEAAERIDALAAFMDKVLPERSEDAIDYFNRYKAEHPDGFITPDAVERFYQIHTHATGNIIYNNRFDLRYVGSSEGTAAFGHGAYFEEAPEVAEVYRRYGLTEDDMRGVLHVYTKDGQDIGVSSFATYSYYYRKFISHCTIDKAFSGEGTEVILHWGDYGKPISRKSVQK